MTTPYSGDPIKEAYDSGRRAGIAQALSAITALEPVATPLVGTGGMVGLRPDAWAVAQAEHEALKTLVEHERNPKPSRPLRDDEADANRIPSDEAQPNK